MAMTLEVLASGYGLLEGPRVDDQNRLYFSDVPNGGVYRRSPVGEIETLIPGRKGVGGIAINQGGGFVCSGRGLVYWNEATRTSRNLFTEWEGRPLKGLNDLQPDDHGSIFVGSLEFDALSDSKPIPGNLFRVDPDGKVTKLWEGSRLPTDSASALTANCSTTPIPLPRPSGRTTCSPIARSRIEECSGRSLKDGPTVSRSTRRAA
jgi:sugar lactone lactonase YvrE